MNLSPGTRVKVFDHLLFKDDVSTPLSVTVKPATIVKGPYKYTSCLDEREHKEEVVDVLFDHRPDRISRAHFVSYVEMHNRE